MNLAQASELADYFEMECTSVLVHGHAIAEIKDAARRQGLMLRIIGPKEFSLPAIHEKARNSLSTNRSNPTRFGLWTGLRQTLHISGSVQVLVFEDIDQLDDQHADALRTIVKGDMDRPEEGLGFKYIWATSYSTAPFRPGLEDVFHRHLWSAPKWLSELESNAAKALTGKLENWPLGGYACPWLRRYHRRTNDRPEIVFVLQDWGISDGEPLDEAISLLDEGNEGKWDPTIKTIHTVLGDVIESHQACIMNAVWGLRKSSKKTGYLGDTIHKAAFPVWANALLQLKPKAVCLCGEWAKWAGLNFEHQESGSDAIERWIAWTKSPAAITAASFDDMTFHYLPHPSAWIFSFSKFSARVINARS
jgi:hypothetical protein